MKDGSRYSPLTDSWVALKQGTEVPDGRYHHTAVWTGEEMVVWGGYGDGEGLTNQGGRYSPATDIWVFTNQGANLPTARHGHTAVWTGTEMVVWGGQRLVSLIAAPGILRQRIAG